MVGGIMNISIDKREKVFVVEITRSERRNAIDSETAKALAAAFRQFDADEDSYVAVLFGQGGTFCAGFDLKSFANGSGNEFNAEGDGPIGPTRMRLTKPVIAAIEGYAVAGGLELALWCDLRVAAKDAILGVFCRRVGVPLVDMGTIRLPRLIGHSRAMDLILTGRPVSGEEAFQIGLVNRIVENGKALKEAMSLANQLAALPQHCMRNDRLSAIEHWDLTESEAIQNELQYGLKTLATGEAKSGSIAFRDGEGRHGAPMSSPTTEA
jgi:enoyl-CoA hydratase